MKTQNFDYSDTGSSSDELHACKRVGNTPELSSHQLFLRSFQKIPNRDEINTSHLHRNDMFEITLKNESKHEKNQIRENKKHTSSCRLLIEACTDHDHSSEECTDVACYSKMKLVIEQINTLRGC